MSNPKGFGFQWVFHMAGAEGIEPSARGFGDQLAKIIKALWLLTFRVLRIIFDSNLTVILLLNNI